MTDFCIYYEHLLQGDKVKYLETGVPFAVSKVLYELAVALAETTLSTNA